MTTRDIALAVALAVALVVLVALGALVVAGERRRRRPVGQASTGRILFPFTGRGVSQRALDAALRIARAEQATLVPVFLAVVPLRVALEGAIPYECGDGMALQEAIEQRAATAGVPVDARIARGRTYRHALRDALDRERYDRVVVAAAGPHTGGLRGDDVAWLLETAPGEVVIIRPRHEDALRPALADAPPARPAPPSAVAVG